MINFDAILMATFFQQLHDRRLVRMESVYQPKSKSIKIFIRFGTNSRNWNDFGAFEQKNIKLINKFSSK